MEIKMGVIIGATEAKIGKISVSIGDIIEKDQILLQYETKKGNRSLKAPIGGKLNKIYFEEGDIIKKNDILFDIEVAKAGIFAESTNVIKIKMIPIIGATEAKIGKLNVSCGETIKIDQELLQYETKKGNRSFKSTIEGQILDIGFEEGQIIRKDDVLFSVKQKKVNPKILDKTAIKNKKSLSTDILFIGGGPGGYVGAIYASKHGKKVILLEKEYLGGTCLNVGCIPTKALVKSSEVCYVANNSETFGIEIPKETIKPNMNLIIEHKNSVVERLISGIDSLMNANEIQVIKGEGRFISETEVEVIENDTLYTITAKNIVIATGSKISKLPIPGLDLPFVLNSTTALSDRSLPKSIAIVGGGVVGMEFAFIYKNLGVDVSVVEYMDRVLIMLDKEESEAIKRNAIDKGIKVYTNSKVTEVNCDIHKKAILTFKKNNKNHFLVAEKILVATGRESNIDGLNLEITGVKMDLKRKGIKVDLHMQTNKEHIYAIGDVTNIIQLAHVASHQGIIAVDNIIGDVKEIDYKAIPNVIFTSPEIATVGVGVDFCEINNIDYKVSKFYFEANGKAVIMEKTKGYIKLIKDMEEDKLIGATIFGADASNLISILTLAIQNEMNEEQIINTIFPHPTTSEAIHEAAMGLGIGMIHQ